MKLIPKKFIEMLKRECLSVRLFCVEFGMTMAELKKMLTDNKALDMEQSEKLIYMFGAKNMKPCIDWEAINVQCPI